MRRLRALRMLCALALAQLRHHPGRWSLLAAGIALVVAVPVVSAGLAGEVRAQSVERAVHQLPPDQRALFVTLEGTAPGAGSPRVDAAVRAQLARLSHAPVRREVQFRRLSASNQQFLLGATDGLAGGVRLTSGRMPRSCTPRRCEVVLVGSRVEPSVAQAVATVGAVVVGTVQRTDPQLFTGQLDPGSVPLVLGDGVTAMSKLAALQLFSRFYAWTAPIDADEVVRLGVPAYLRLGSAVDAALARSVYRAVFLRPDTVLQDADHRAQVSTRRFELLGGLAAALLLGFAVVAASGLRRETSLLVSVLRRRGAGAASIGTVVAAESVLACLAGAVVGTGLGAGAVAVLTDHAAIPRSVGDSVSRALSDATAAAAVLTGLAALVVTAVLLWPDARAQAVWRLTDLIVLFSVGAAVLAAERGSADLSGGSDPLVVTLPVLICVVGGLVAARLWAPFARLAARLLPRGSVAGRIGLLGMIRRPLRPAATVAFLTAAIASVVFAGAYRATLFAGDADQAAYQVPLDATLTVQGDGPTPAALIDRHGQPHGAVAYPVLRVAGAVTRLAGVVDAVPTVGVDADALPQVAHWSRVTGSSLSPQQLATALRTAAVPSGPRIPGGTTVTIAATGRDGRTVVGLWLGTPSGAEVHVPLRWVDGQLRGTVPSVGAVPLHLVAVGIDISSDYLDRQQHSTGEGTTDQPTVSGTLTLGTITAGSATIRPDWSSWGSAQGVITPRGDRIAIGYRLAGRATVVVPSFAASAAELPVAIDAVTAQSEHGGTLSVTLDGSVPVIARVVAVLPRFPTVHGPFILADRAALARALDRGEPGRTPTEDWLSGSTSSLHDAPWTELAAQVRSAVQADLDSDPIGRGARTLLTAVALLALAAGAVSLVLLVVGERRDGAGEFYAWEADGTRPRTLRRMLGVRLALVALTAIPLGVLTGLVLARVGTDLVAVDASGTAPTPPLAVTLGSLWTPAALAAGIGAGVLLGLVVALSSLRERYPVAAEADLR